MTLPDALSRLRLILAPGLVLLALLSDSGPAVAGFLLFLQVTDWIDGPIARRQGTQSPAGARLDSLADATMFGSLLGALVVLEGPLLLGEWPWIGVAAASYATSAGYALVRLGAMPTYHQWSAKVSGPVTLLAAVAVLFAGEAWPLRVAAAAVTLGNLEAIAITRRLDAPATDVRSVFALERETGPEPRAAPDVGSETGGRVRGRRWALTGGVIVTLWLVGWFVVIPYPRGLASGDPGPTAMMEQRGREARAAGDSLVIRREWVDLGAISRHVVRAVIVAEDYRFREHEGVDWVSLAEEVRWTGGDDFSWLSPSDLGALREAVVYAWRNRAELRGRSTITQQLAKNLYFGTDRSFVRKATELVVARRLERRLDKDRILELYLNAAEWGPGVFGVEAAARVYFGRSAADVTLRQAAALAATLPHPLTSNPAYRPSRMAWRRDLILSRLSPTGVVPPGPIAEPLPELVIPDSLAPMLEPGPDPVPSDTVSPLPDTVPSDTVPEAPAEGAPATTPPPGGGA